jgi:tetratricopeptide (TPR) repeat protein
MRLWMAALACLALAAPVARAQEGSAKEKESLEEARQHAAKAKVHYDLGEYKEAAEEYINVYRVKPLPALLFNIAQSYRQAGMYEKARSFYKAYLREAPDAKNKPAIEQSIREMDELLAKEKRTKDGPPKGVKEPMGSTAAAAALPVKTPESPAPKMAKKAEPPAATPSDAQKGAAAAAAPAAAGSQAATKPPDSTKVAVATPPPQAPPKSVPSAASSTSQPAKPASSASSGTRTAAWITGGTAVALLAGGGLFAIKASGKDSDLQSGGLTRAQADQLISDSNSSHKMSGILLGAGLAAAATSAVLFLAF